MRQRKRRLNFKNIERKKSFEEVINKEFVLCKIEVIEELLEIKYYWIEIENKRNDLIKSIICVLVDNESEKMKKTIDLCK